MLGNFDFEVYKFLDLNKISVTLVASDANRLGIYSHFKLYWKTFSAETRVIARKTCLNLNLKKNYIINRTYPRALNEGEGECHSPLHRLDLDEAWVSPEQNKVRKINPREIQDFSDR